MPLALFASAATARLVADYRFDGNLQSSVGGASEAFASGANLAFRTEDVARCNRQVATFPVDQGVAIHTKDVIGSGSYTMIMQARFESVPPDGYVRAINWFPSFAVDNGLYLYQGKLDFYDNNVSPADHQGTATVQPNRYVELAVSREAGSKLITGYVNGAPQFIYTDTFDQAISPHPAGNIYFFVDNGNEESAGAIARIRVYDHVLPAGEILNTVGCFEQRCGGTAVTLVGDDRGNVLEGTPARDVIEDLGATTRSGGWRGTTSSAGTRARTSCSAARAGTGCWEVRARTGWREPWAATPAAARPGATVARAASGVAVSRARVFPGSGGVSRAASAAVAPRPPARPRSLGRCTPA